MAQRAILRIEKLNCSTLIGVYDHERNQAQDLFVSLSCIIDISKASKTDHINDTLDYDKLCRLIRELCEESNFELLESLIVFMKNELEHQFNLKDLTLKIEKPGAIEDCVGVSLEL